MNRILLVLTAVCLGFNASAQLPVLISECVWKKPNSAQPFAPYDSVIYIHSNGRNSTIPQVGEEEFGQTIVASTYNLSPIQADGIYMYDSCQHHYYEPVTQTWDTLSRIFQVFGTNGQVATQLSKVYHASSSSWQYADKTEYVYGAGNTLDTITYYAYNPTSALWDFHSRNVYFHNTGKRQVALHSYKWTSSSWNLYSTDSFWYNMAGDATRYGSWGSGIPNTTNQGEHFELAYNAGHQLVADTGYTGGALTTHDTYQYNSNGSLATSFNYYWSGGWQSPFKTEYHYDSNNNLIDFTGYMWQGSTNTFVPWNHTAYTYNSFNQVTSYNDGNTLKRYYYGPAPVTVSSVQQNNSLLLYPVPATSYINLELHTATPQNLSVSITDMGGRTIKQWTEANVQHYKKFIPVTDIAPGNYTLQVIGKETISKTFSVIR